MHQKLVEGNTLSAFLLQLFSPWTCPVGVSHCHSHDSSQLRRGDYSVASKFFTLQFFQGLMDGCWDSPQSTAPPRGQPREHPQGGGTVLSGFGLLRGDSCSQEIGECGKADFLCVTRVQ